MEDIIIRLIKLSGLESEEKGICHGSGVLALQAFILGTEYYQSYIKRLEKIAQLNSESDDEVLKQALESRDEQGVLKYSDILAHLQTVKLFHSPEEYLELSNSITTLRQSDVAAVASIAQSQLAEKRGGICLASSFSVVYKHTDMEAYLTSLQKVMETPVHKETRCGLLLSSNRHLIMLGYDAANSIFPWTVDNAATVTPFSSDQCIEVAKKIREIFTNDPSSDKPLILCTDVYSTADQLEKAKSLIDSWHSHCEEIHQVTVEKAKLIGPAGVTWLFRAAESGHTKTVELLLKKGADINVITSEGRTPLYVAAGNGHTETVKLLLEMGVDANAKISDGFTALDVAAEGGYTAIVELLFEAGADANAVASNGLIPPDMAEDECAAVIKAFEKRGAIKVQIEDNRTHIPVLLQRLFSFFAAASIVALGIALSIYFFSSTVLLLAIAFTTTIVTAITVKYLPRVVEQGYAFMLGSGRENKLENLSQEQEAGSLCESTAHCLLTSPLDSQTSTNQTQQREEACPTNSEQSHYNRLSA